MKKSKEKIIKREIEISQQNKNWHSLIVFGIGNIDCRDGLGISDPTRAAMLCEATLQFVLRNFGISVILAFSDLFSLFCQEIFLSSTGFKTRSLSFFLHKLNEKARFWTLLLTLRLQRLQNLQKLKKWVKNFSHEKSNRLVRKSRLRFQRRPVQGAAEARGHETHVSRE